MKRFLLVVLIVLSCAAVGTWFAWPRLIGIVRERLVQVIVQEIGRPTRVDELSVSLVPIKIHFGGVEVGVEPAVMARVTSVDVRLWALASLTEWRPVLSASIDAPMVDLAQLPAPKGAPTERQPTRRGLPSFRVKELVLTRAQLRFRLRDVDTMLALAQARGQLDSRSVGQRVSAMLDASGIDLQRRERHLTLTQVRLDGGANRGEVFVNTATVTGDAVNASLSAVSLTHRYALDARLDVGALSAFFDEAVAGEARLKGTLSGALINPGADVRLAIDRVTVGQRAFGDLTTRLTRDGQVVRITDLNVFGQIGHLSGAADLTTAEQFPVHADVRLEDIDVQTVLASIGRPLEFHDQLTATATVAGTLRPLHLSVSSSGTVQRTDQQPPQQVATLDLKGDFDPQSVQTHLEFVQQQNRLDANLAVKQSQLDGHIEVQAPDLATLDAILPASLRRLRVTGRMQSGVTLAGPTARPTITATVAANDLTVMGAPIHHIGGAFTIQGATLTTPGVKIDTGAGSADLNGTLALGAAGQNDWHIAINGLETDSLVAMAHAFTENVPIYGGRIDGAISGRGAWARVEVDANLSAVGLYASGEPVQRVDIRATAHLPEWTLHAVVLHTPTESLTVAGSGSGTERVQLDIDSTPIQLANLRGASRRQTTGTIVLHAQITGRPLAPDGFIRIDASQLGIESRQLGDMALHATGKGGDWVLLGSAFGNAADLRAQLRMGGEYPYTFTLRLRDLQLAPLLSPDPLLRVVTEGEIALTGSAKALQTPSGTVRIDRFEAQRGEYRVAAAEPIRIDAERGQFRIRSFELAAPDSRLHVTGGFTTSGLIDIQARGDGDLVLLEFIGRPFSSARGQFTVAVHIQRQSQTGWQLSGRGDIRDTTLDLGLPIAFTDVNGAFSLAGSSVRIDTLDGKTGGGHFHVDGDVSLNRGPNLTWRIQNVSASTSEGLEAEASGAGRVQGTWKVIDVNGDVEIVNALYDRNLELVNFLPFFREHVRPAPRTQPPAVQVNLHLHIHAPGGLYIDNNVAKVEMSTDLYIEGTADKPRVRGTVDFLTGEVNFRQRTFNVTGGSVQFRGGARINPILNISAESQMSTADADYTIAVTVTGTADDPRIQLSADDPTLTETDILSLITFGATTAQLQRQGGGISAVDALALLPTGSVTGPIAKVLGVNRLEVEAVQSPIAGSAGSIEPRVTIGKDLTDRLRASLSSTFGGVATERIAQLEYRVTRGISLLGSWEGETTDQSGAWGGGIKFRYEFRKLPFTLFPSGFETTAAGQNAP